MRIDLETTHLGMVQTARDNVIAAIKCQRDVVQGTADSVSALFATSEWRPGTSGDAIASAVTNGAVRGAFEMGASLDGVAQGILLGAIGEDAELPAPFLDIIRQTSRGTVNAVAGVDGDVGAAVNGLLDAATQSATARGLNRDHAATAAADGAMLAASQFTEIQSETVRLALSKSRESNRYGMGLGCCGDA